ncbi:MAG: hypothetical protein ACPL8I_05200 [Chloroflexaceae bacterium]
MPRLEGWGFVCLIGCAATVALSLSLLAGAWQAIGCGVAAMLGILSGGLYAASVGPRSESDAEPGAAADDGA